MRPCVGRDSSTVVIGLSGRGDALELSDSDEPRSLDCVDARCRTGNGLTHLDLRGSCRRGNTQGASPAHLAHMGQTSLSGIASFIVHSLLAR